MSTPSSSGPGSEYPDHPSRGEGAPHPSVHPTLPEHALPEPEGGPAVPAGRRKRWWQVLYIQVLIAVALGILTGHFFPGWAGTLKVLGDAFIGMVKMVIAPIIFCTIVHGIASTRNLGRIGVKAFIYFDVVSTLALIIGLVVVNYMQPGKGMNMTPEYLRSQSAADLEKVKKFVDDSKAHSMKDFFLDIIPHSYLEPFSNGKILQVLFIAILTGIALASLGERGHPALHVLDQVGAIAFAVMGLIVKVAPLGDFGAMAFTVGQFGLGSLAQLLYLMVGFYVTALIFIVVVLGSISWWAGFSIFRFISYIRDELLLVLGTSSSETALPGMMEKTRRLGCADSTVGFVIPSGYSFNLDGTNIYIAMAVLFLAQATNTHLSVWDQILVLGVAMVSSKGAAGVTGAGFVTLAATLAAVPQVPIESLAILLGIDRFMSECRALTNLVGNGVATVAISRWEGEVTPEQLNARMVHTGFGPAPRAVDKEVG
ncbi:dicarboxylate/amino acid:cation symporter [Verrucomicrobia bacterium LW23]|nr:dicarboxylate/amino acid:cation symporter [Verrucomicrobia bacterium LW23]